MTDHKFGIAASLMIGAIDLYRLTLSAFVGRQCRYLPTCSEYSSEAIARHGAWRGLRLALARIARCHPWGGSGFDPVPHELSQEAPEKIRLP
jgi:putative membrane protein insertion efficiency factor